MINLALHQKTWIDFRCKHSITKNQNILAILQIAFWRRKYDENVANRSEHFGNISLENAKHEFIFKFWWEVICKFRLSFKISTRLPKIWKDEDLDLREKTCTVPSIKFAENVLTLTWFLFLVRYIWNPLFLVHVFACNKLLRSLCQYFFLNQTLNLSPGQFIDFFVGRLAIQVMRTFILSLRTFER